MPLLSTLGGATAQTFGGKIAYGGSIEYGSIGVGQYLNPGSPFAYGTGDFTIEMWMYPTAFNRVLWHQGAESFYTFTGGGLFARRVFNDRRYLMLYINSAGQISLQLLGTDAYITTSNTATVNAWNHVALVRSSGIIRIFLNGNSSPTAALATNFSDTTYSPFIGRYSYTTAAGFTGYISNVRVAKSAYYFSAFVPSRTPFTRTSQGASNVQLLLNQLTSNRLLTDSSINNLTVTNASTTWNNQSPFLVPYVPFAPFVNVSAIITPSVTTAREGDTITFTVAGTNTPNGTYYYTIEQPIAELTGADFTSGSLSGSFTISGNSGSFAITSVSDLTTEEDAVFAVYVRQTSISGAVIGSSAEITLTDTSITPSFTVTPTSINEGDSGTFTVQNVGPDGTYYWTLEYSGGASSADFSVSSGSFTVSGSTGGIDNGTGSFSVTPALDRTTEGGETIRAQVRSGSVSGTVIVSSPLISIGDTSLTPAFTVAPASINEGSSGSFTVNNLGAADTYYWTVLNGTTANADFTVTSGSFTTSTLNGDGSFSVTTVADRVTEGSQTFQVQVRTGSVSGTVILTSSSVTINDISLTPSLTTSTNQIRESTTITNSIPFTVTFTASNLGPAGTYFWTVDSVAGQSMPLSGDFSDGLLSGSFTTSTLNGSATITRTTTTVDVVEDITKVFALSIRPNLGDSPIVTSSNVSVLDSSVVITVTSSGFPTTTINEGLAYDLTVRARDGTPGGTYTWEIVNVTTTNADFVVTNGAFSFVGGVQTVVLTNTIIANSGDGAESGQLFQIRVRDVTSQIFGESGNITILANAT